MVFLNLIIITSCLQSSLTYRALDNTDDIKHCWSHQLHKGLDMFYHTMLLYWSYSDQLHLDGYPISIIAWIRSHE